MYRAQVMFQRCHINDKGRGVELLHWRAHGFEKGTFHAGSPGGCAYREWWSHLGGK
jgi:hypothetical protein